MTNDSSDSSDATTEISDPDLFRIQDQVELEKLKLQCEIRKLDLHARTHRTDWWKRSATWGAVFPSVLGLAAVTAAFTTGYVGKKYELLKIQRERINEKQSVLNDDETELVRAQDEQETKEKALEKDQAILLAAQTALGGARTKFKLDEKALIKNRAVLKKDQLELDERRTKLTKESEELQKRIPFEVALRVMLSSSDAFAIERARQPLADVLQAAGDLREEFLKRMESAVTPETDQSLYIGMCKILFAETSQRRWIEAVNQRLQTEPIIQHGAIVLQDRDDWGRVDSRMFLRTVVTTALSSSEPAHWHGMGLFIRAYSGEIVEILGSEQTLNLVTFAAEFAKTREHGWDQAMVALAAVGSHPYYATVAEIINSGVPFTEEFRLQLKNRIREGPPLNSRPDSVDPTAWRNWLEGATAEAREVNLWIEKGLVELRTLDATDLIARSGWRRSPVPGEPLRPALDLNLATQLIEVDAPATTSTEEGPSEAFQFRFVVEAAGQYVIETAGDLDLVLELYFSANQQKPIGENDDGDDGSMNAKLAIQLDAGEYFVVVHDYDYPVKSFSSSEFSVSVRSNNP